MSNDGEFKVKRSYVWRLFIFTLVVVLSAGLLFPGCGGDSGTSICITTTDLPYGCSREPYNSSLSVSGGEAPYSWSIISGSLPPGLSLDSSSGRISGTPTKEGFYNFTVQVSDNSSPPHTASKALEIDIY